MLPDVIVTLIREEQVRQQGRFVEAVNLDEYLEKLGAKAEVLADLVDGRCRGLVAFYCNNETTKQAYITLVVVDPRDRGLGLGQSLVSGVLDMARRRGFTTCLLEVAQDNQAAQTLYRSLGFSLVGHRGGKDLLELGL